jgi:hypothetical protein
MPDTRTLGKKKATGTSLGQKKPSWLQSWFGVKETYDYPGEYGNKPVTPHYDLQGRKIPMLSKPQAQEMMGDMLFHQQTGYDANEMAHSDKYSF